MHVPTPPLLRSDAGQYNAKVGKRHGVPLRTWRQAQHGLVMRHNNVAPPLRVQPDVPADADVVVRLALFHLTVVVRLRFYELLKQVLTLLRVLQWNYGAGEGSGHEGLLVLSSAARTLLFII